MNLKPIKTLNLLFFVTLISLSCDDNSNIKPLDGLPSTFKVISNSENHQILTNLLMQTGLNEVLDEGIFTVFAPTDEAFDGLDVNSISNNQLTNLLLYHIIQGNATSNNLSSTYFNTRATVDVEGNEHQLSLLINVAGNILLNGIAEVTEVDIEASNGTIHSINNVLSIPNLKYFVEFDPNLSSLLATFTYENQPDFLSVFDTDINTSPAPITLFAPSNEAFATAVGLLGLENLEEVEQSVLTEILNLHILIEQNQRKINFSNEGFETLAGNVSYDTDNEFIIDANERAIEFSIIDVQTTNGVMHVLQDVILIETELQEPVDPINQVNFTLNHDENLAYFVSEINGNEEVTTLNENNSTWTLSQGTRYTIEVINAENHPLEFRNQNNEILLAQSEAILGLFEEDTNINFIVEGNSFSFTLAEGLASQLTSYNCSNHITMNGSILVE